MSPKKSSGLTADAAVAPQAIELPAEKLSARDRLLAAASELFYEEGINTVGIDRVIAHAGVAKASLYSAFGSKEELIRSYLEAQFEARKERLLERIAQHDTPRDKLLAIFDLMGELFEKTSFRGCAFIRASAEAKPDSSIAAEADKSRAWTRSVFVDLARQAGAKHPEQLAKQLALLYDGAIVTAQMDRDIGAARDARDMAAALLDSATRP
jgi:AcrR family transcriptional regulator